jgi:superfamily II DNA or RNA helicase
MQVHPGKRPSPRKVRKVRIKKLSRLRKPEDMSLEQWQIALRREFGRQQNFRLKNVGGEAVFSEFDVTNPQTRRTYRVAIRGEGLGENYCSCPDFTTNTLGTCKHVEFTLARLRRNRQNRKLLAAGFRPAYCEVYVRYGAKREVMFRSGTSCPEGLLRAAEQYFDEHNRLEADAYLRFHTFLRQAAHWDHELRCYDDALALIAEVRDRARLAEEISRAFPRGTGSPAFKNLLKVPLYPYQCEGALFAAKTGRCLIADDMGLGKTIEAIAAAEILARTVGLQRVLIVSPTSLKHQWRREIEKFTDRPALVVEGLSPSRAQLYAGESFYKITNYDVVHRDLEMIRRWEPELVILDEAQRIKNWKTRTAGSVKQLQSQYAFVLTGTPLENRLEELHSIVQFVDRFRLGPMFRFLDAHQHVDQNGRVVGYRNLSRISQTLAPILIRRTKDKVLRELPERMDKRMFVPMTPEQRKHHDENRELVAKIVAKWRRLGFLPEADQRRLMIFLQNMRMSCDSSYLLDQSSDHGVKADELMTLLGEILESPETKVVIFSQWVRMHELVVARLNPRRLEHVLFYGGVPGPKRKDLVHRFKEDPECRLFLATDAGGVGLNLQRASVVVNLDQPWNPAVLEQRIGRVHRLGQHRPVRVVHFISQGTIEEGMLALLGFKQSMFSGVLDGGQDEVFMGGTRLKHFMESVEKATGSIPASMPAETPAPADEEAPDAEEGENGRAMPSRGPEAEEPATAESQPQRPAPGALWSDVLTAGVNFLQKLTQTVAAGKGEAGTMPLSGLGSIVARDEPSGQPYLKLPLPNPEVLQQLLGILAPLLREA